MRPRPDPGHLHDPKAAERSCRPNRLGADGRLRIGRGDAQQVVDGCRTAHASQRPDRMEPPGRAESLPLAPTTETDRKAVEGAQPKPAPARDNKDFKNTRPRDAVLSALRDIHATLTPEQRGRLAYLIRTGALVV